jgi:hypothetical protein
MTAQAAALTLEELRYIRLQKPAILTIVSPEHAAVHRRGGVIRDSLTLVVTVAGAMPSRADAQTQAATTLTRAIVRMELLPRP